MLEEQFCKRLTQLRQKKGVSARDMSLSLGQSEAYINRIENHKMLPSMMTFFYICEYLQITPQEFFDTEQSNPAKINDILAELAHLNDAQLDTVLAVAKGLHDAK